ncbi:MAG TPA: AAA family ATPase [Candidatus Omnitrophota bacterium]|nr:AAA family ATPase [Candidatus Omnitrophota bacterium]
MSAKKIFIAATMQNDGKTTVSLGLIFALREKFKKIGFIKPIGQRYLEEEGAKIDEDSVLIERVCEICDVRCALKDMSPVAVERGFTEKYIDSPNKSDITEHILESYEHISKGRDLMIIEGTGHAGVGSVFDHSNATVAKLLDSKVILISSGGVGRPIDEIMLNKALFEKEGVELLGVIVNKVLPEKYDKISNYVRKGLTQKGIRVLGVVPFYPMLNAPSISQILEETDFELISGGANVNNRVSSILVGAMEPQNALNYFKDECLIITAGDREDMLTTTLSQHYAKLKGKGGASISGIILTGGIRPYQEIMDTIAKSGIPLILSKEDTYHTTYEVHDLTVKIRPQDKEKIEKIKEVVKSFVEIEKILENI